MARSKFFGAALALPAMVAAATVLLAIPAQAVNILPVLNPNFTTVGSAPKGSFNSVNPGNWSENNGGAGGNLVYIDAPGTATSFTGGYGVYGPFNNPPTGGNFVQSDANPTYAGVFWQNITGLTSGQTYQLTFYQAAGQQNGAQFFGATSDQWIVSLGSAALTYSISGNQATYQAASGATTVATQVMNTPSMGVTDWQQVTINFVANASHEVLSFLAWNVTGSTATNIPPTVFLAGINATKVPEPMTLSLFSVGLAGLALRRRAHKKTKA